MMGDFYGVARRDGARLQTSGVFAHGHTRAVWGTRPELARALARAKEQDGTAHLVPTERGMLGARAKWLLLHADCPTCGKVVDVRFDGTLLDHLPLDGPRLCAHSGLRWDHAPLANDEE